MGGYGRCLPHGIRSTVSVDYVVSSRTTTNGARIAVKNNDCTPTIKCRVMQWQHAVSSSLLVCLSAKQQRTEINNCTDRAPTRSREQSIEQERESLATASKADVLPLQYVRRDQSAQMKLSEATAQMLLRVTIRWRLGFRCCC